MVIDQLLSDLLLHAKEGIVLAGQITLQLRESSLHELLNLEVKKLISDRTKKDKYS